MSQGCEKDDIFFNFCDFYVGPTGELKGTASFGILFNAFVSNIRNNL